MKEITFIRHAQSEANDAGVWNGRGDGYLSREGERQLESFGQRLRRMNFDAVVSSPLQRARLTAEAFSDDVLVDDEFVELDLGKWEGLTAAEVDAQDAEHLRAAVSSRGLPMGESGESLDEAGQRALNAMGKLADSMPEGSSAAVVTHGGLLQTILHQFLPGGKHRVHAFVDNTSLTRVKILEGRSRLATFNDTGHLGPHSLQVKAALDSGQPVLALIRHGRTRANVERRWQGHTDWGLDDLGHRQGEALGNFYGKWGTVFSSPLKRATQTAAYVAAGDPTLFDDLREINMGNWEGLTTDEIAAEWPQLMDQIYTHGQDIPRGETGETWADLTKRFRAAVESVPVATGEPTLVVAHGGAIRSYVSSLSTTKDTYSESLFTPANTSVTHIGLTDRGPLIMDFGVASHLEGLET